MWLWIFLFLWKNLRVKVFFKNNINDKEILMELMSGSGVVVVKNVFDIEKIQEARELINYIADTQEQKESHFNAEAEADGKIHLQQRVWNLFGKGNVFSKLISFCMKRKGCNFIFYLSLPDISSDNISLILVSI